MPATPTKRRPFEAIPGLPKPRGLHEEHRPRPDTNCPTCGQRGVVLMAARDLTVYGWLLRQVRPRSPGQEGANCRLSRTELARQSPLADAPGGPSRTDGSDIGRSQAGATVAFAARASLWMRMRAVALTARLAIRRGRHVRLPALGNHVLRVVGGSTKEQMIRADTGRVVAAVADEQAVRDRSVGQFPGHTVSRSVASGMRSISEPPIAGFSHRRRPLPTTIGLADLGPEAIGSGLDGSLVHTPGHGIETSGTAAAVVILPLLGHQWRGYRVQGGRY